MTDAPRGPVPDPGAFADLVCDWCLEVGAGARVLVTSTTLAEPFALALHRAILEREGWPFVSLVPPSNEGSFYRHAHERHYAEPPPIELALLRGVDALVRIDAPANTNELSGIDPSLIARAAVARRPLRELTLSRRWCGTLVPTPALAQQAGMSEHDYAAFVNGALFLDRADPAAAWRELSTAQAQLIERLAPARMIRIEADGTDLTLEVSGRTWINSDGRRNMPSGEVFTGPLERSANGTIRFTVPTGPRGVTVTGVAADVPRRRGNRRQRRARSDLPRRRSGDRLGLASAGRDRDRHQRRNRPPNRPHPARREDGRHRPPRARSLLPGDRGQQRLGPALGSDL